MTPCQYPKCARLVAQNPTGFRRKWCPHHKAIVVRAQVRGSRKRWAIRHIDKKRAKARAWSREIRRRLASVGHCVDCSVPVREVNPQTGRLFRRCWRDRVRQSAYYAQRQSKGAAA